jgi:hypothetical protein
LAIGVNFTKNIGAKAEKLFRKYFFDAFVATAFGQNAP